MSFLRLGALWALPLVLIPIVIHLIHRRRHPTAPWAAMMFLRRATQARRGPAKLRRWLILAVRTLVVAAVVFALARPLSSGMFGVAASRVVSGAPSVVVLDRSASMQRRTESGLTHQAAALRRVAETLRTLGTGRVVLIDSVSVAPIELADVDALTDPQWTGGAASAADVPTMLRVAMQYLMDHDHPVADVWVCSDGQANDWRPDAESWSQVAEAAESLGDGVRLHLVDVAEDPRVNTSVVVTRQRVVDTGSDSDPGSDKQLTVSAVVQRQDDASVVVPLRVLVGGVTKTFDVRVDGGRGELIDARVPVPDDQDTLYGRVSIPADVNAADDDWFFVASADRDRPIGLVTQSPCLALEVAADVLGNVVVAEDSPGGAEQGSRLQRPGQLTGGVACLIWQGQLPVGDDAAAVTRFLESGGSVVFFPPSDVDRANEFQAVRWEQWTRGTVRQARFDQWELPIAASCCLDGQMVRLAEIGAGELWIGKVRVGSGAAWFCGADVIDPDSLFVRDGLVLYGLLSEAIEASPLQIAGDGGIVAGTDDRRLQTVQTGAGAFNETAGIETLLASDNEAVGIPLGHGAGVFAQRHSAEGPPRVLAINRPAAESDPQTISDSQLQGLLGDGRWNHVVLRGPQADSGGGLVHEIWGVIWVMMIVGMLCEAWLTLPPRTRGESRWS
ncbi:hypothetical protein Enr13x_67740 [Stieleria neptunia]|uniref:Aerotolerance regulator N-terminal domain-containing protein n=1 Tax=Stieleria neptunia TaxID=2527979 RepID=A0A518I185_9BACT|nr:BatA domain-containing protein [Stieleria neptunia]QDV46865.1 hypothetical protein Enr13x_67740 [Stieleria neptunia]